MIEEFYAYGGHDCHHTVAGACLAKPAVQDRQLHTRLVAALGIPAKFLAIAMAISWAYPFPVQSYFRLLRNTLQLAADVSEIACRQLHPYCRFASGHA